MNLIIIIGSLNESPVYRWNILEHSVVAYLYPVRR